MRGPDAPAGCGGAAAAPDQQAPGFCWQNWLKSAPPDPPGFVVVGAAPPPVSLGAVCVGVAVPPPVLGGAAGACVGSAAVPPVAAVPEDELELELEVLGVVAVVDVVVVDVVAVDAELDGVVVPPEGGAVRAGVVLGTL